MLSLLVGEAPLVEGLEEISSQVGVLPDYECFR